MSCSVSPLALLALLVVVAAARCRAAAVASVLSVGVALLVTAVLHAVIERPVGLYPTVEVVLGVIGAVLAPLAIATLARRSRLVLPLRLVAAVGVTGGAVSRVADGSTLPTDVIGGVLIGACVASAATWMIAPDGAHASCRGCLWRPASRHEHVVGVIHLGGAGPALVRFVAHVTSAFVVVGLTTLTLTVGLPANTEGYVFGASVERPAQLALAGLVSIGALLAYRWVALGAVVIALAATCLGIFAAIEYRPAYAVALSAATMTPAVLLWLSWQHDRRPHELLALGVVTAMLLSGTWIGANRVYDEYFGPTHPESTAAALSVDRVEWVWAGALAENSITVTARLASGRRSAELVVEPRLGGEPRQSSVALADDHRLVRMMTDGLAADTEYSYRVVVDGVADTSRGHGTFRTPAGGAMSFRVAVASCARTGSNGAVFDAIAASNPLFYINLGDIHYSNIASDEAAAFLDAYDKVLTLSRAGGAVPQHADRVRLGRPRLRTERRQRERAGTDAVVRGVSASRAALPRRGGGCDDQSSVHDRTRSFHPHRFAFGARSHDRARRGAAGLVDR